MTRLPGKKLRTKMSFGLGLAIVSIVLPLGGVAVIGAKRILINDLVEKGQTLARSLAKGSANGIATGNVLRDLDELVSTLNKESDVLYAGVVDANGRALAESGKLKNGGLSSSPSHSKPLHRPFSVNGRHGFEFYHPVERPSQEVGLGLPATGPIGMVRLVLSSESIQSRARYVILLGSLLTMALILAGVLFSIFISNWIVRQLDTILGAYRTVEQGDYTLRLPILSRDEMGEMALAFNHMVETLAKNTEERKKMEEITRRSEKMSALGQMAAGVAHEINNPLGIIMGFSQSIRSQVRDESILMPLDFIEKEATRCKELVQNLLVFSRSSKAGPQEQKEIDIYATVEEALSLVTAQSRVKNVELARELKSELPKIWANKNQIQQIIINLCNNAMDAMPNGGTITLRTNVAQRNGMDWVMLAVSDTGTGMSKETQSKIFEPFFTTKEAGKGTGLGLSLVFEIVQKHNGTIEVESDVGQGTTFTVYFPVQAGSMKKAA